MRIIALALLVLGSTPARQEDDTLFRVLKDELDRSMKRLKVEHAARPYYLGYAVQDTKRYTLRAAFGALSGRGDDHERQLTVDVRVGDYGLDNSNLTEGGAYYGNSTDPITIDDDLEAIRHAVWLQTDSTYKDAVEGLEKKKAYLQENDVKDKPDDFSREEPVVSVSEPAQLKVDRDRWPKIVRKLSAVFRDFPEVQNSLVFFSAEANTRWFLNSEGFKSRTGRVEMGLFVLATAQAADGMRFSDSEWFAGASEGDLPSDEALEKATRAMARRLTELRNAPAVEEYSGPILFEGRAAADFFQSALAPHVGNAHEPLGQRAELSNPLRERIGRRILPRFVTVVDDPTRREFNGHSILGGYDVDDDGVKGQKITLVEKGVLRTFCTSRVPTRHVKRSNGHSHGGVGEASVLVIQSESRLAAKDLKQKLIDLGKDDELDYVYIARRLANPLSALLDPQSNPTGSGSGVALPSPVLLYRVSVRDGKEELVRGARFQRLTLRVLRDIDAVGDDDGAYAIYHESGPNAHLITPSVVVREVEISKPGRETEKPPVLKNPYFDK